MRLQASRPLNSLNSPATRGFSNRFLTIVKITITDHKHVILIVHNFPSHIASDHVRITLVSCIQTYRPQDPYSKHPPPTNFLLLLFTIKLEIDHSDLHESLLLGRSLYCIIERRNSCPREESSFRCSGTGSNRFAPCSIGVVVTSESLRGGEVEATGSFQP